MSRWTDMWNAAAGKVNDNGMFSFKYKNSSRLWKSEATFDYTRNDYDLSRSIYYGSSINGKGKGYLLGSAFAKPIVNTAAAFSIGLGFNVKLKIKDKDITEADEKAADQANEWIQSNMASIVLWNIHSLRDGDSYLYIDELAKLDEFDAANVDVVLDTITGDKIGFDVTEVVEEKKPGANTTTNYKIVKHFRQDSIRFDKFDEHDKFMETIFERVYTVNGVITPTENQEFYEDELEARQLPVIHMANDKEPRAIYGNSELQNLYIYMREYHRVLDHATINVIYNSAPIAVVKGITAPQAAANASQSNADKEDGAQAGEISWEPKTTVYLNGENADAKFIQANGVVQDAKELLKTYFNLIVEASETPEFVFGTAVQSSKASTETQMPVLIQKAERKRIQLEGNLIELVKAYVDRQIRLSNPTFLPYRDKEVKVEVTFPDINTEDKAVTLTLIEFAHQAGLVSDETALQLLLSDKIENIQEEVEKARSEGATRAEQANILPDDPDRLNDELGDDEPEVTPSPED